MPAEDKKLAIRNRERENLLELSTTLSTKDLSILSKPLIADCKRMLEEMQEETCANLQAVIDNGGEETEIDRLGKEHTALILLLYKLDEVMGLQSAKTS